MSEKRVVLFAERLDGLFTGVTHKWMRKVIVRDGDTWVQHDGRLVPVQIWEEDDSALAVYDVWTDGKEHPYYDWR